jgi:succinyl-CoA synthetase alpha subunit
LIRDVRKRAVIPTNLYCKGDIGIVSHNGILKYEIILKLLPAEFSLSGLDDDFILVQVYSDAMGVSSVGDNIRSIDLIGEV